MITQEDKQWDLSEEIVADLKEIFILFDTDTDGVLTIEQVYQAMNVMGMRRPGNIIVEMRMFLAPSGAQGVTISVRPFGPNS